MSDPVKVTLSVEHAAAALEISRDGFERFVLPQIRVLRVGRRILVPVRELERYVERNASRALVDELERLRR